MLYLCLFIFVHAVNASEQMALIPPTEEELKVIISGFKASHQLSTAPSIDRLLEEYVTDACQFIPHIGYATKNNENTRDFQSALFAYYIDYQNHLLQPIRHPHNIIYKIYWWHRMRTSEKKFKEQIGIVHKNIMPHKSLSNECDSNIAVIQRLSRELVQIEKRMKKGDH